jgi:DUF971 family protein
MGYVSAMSPDAAQRGPFSAVPTEIRAHRPTRTLHVTFDDGAHFEFSFEFLRVNSPSAEVKGHGPGQETLVLGKQDVGIRALEQVGQYAIRIIFDDGHDTGLYSWKYLHELGRDQAALWRSYRARVAAALESQQ